MKLRSLTLLLIATCWSCSDEMNLVPLDWSLNRMTEQERYTPFKQGQGFRDGRAMQPPPAGTVDRERSLGPISYTLGITETGQYVNQIPIRLDRDIISMGRNRYDRTCAVCHGILGTGDSEVAMKMPFIKPPSLHSAEIMEFAPGRIYQVATFGYGIMPAYDYQLNDTERWAIVAYIRALQLSQSAHYDELPREFQQRFHSEVP